MSNHIYITRHGESQWNIEGKVQGVTDTPLTAKGIEQAHELARKIKEKGIKIDAILYSPLIRAADTAKILAEENGLSLTLEPRLIEQNFGRYESTPRNGAEFHEAKKDMASRFGTGESMLHLAQRIYNLLDDIKVGDREVILVAHNGITRMVESYFREMDNEEFSSCGIKNCEIKRYNY